MKRHAERVAWPHVAAAMAPRHSWRSILPALVLVFAVIALLPHAAEASRLRGVSFSEAAASATDVSAWRHQRDSTPTPTTTPTLVWSDEFNGAAYSYPDASKWYTMIAGGGFGDNELQFYTSRGRNLSCDGNGNLKITAIAEEESGHDYTSGYVDTRQLYATTYGSIQARIKVPAGQGLWPAFWAVGADREEVGAPLCGEIDMMEILGHDPFTVHATIHGQQDDPPGDWELTTSHTVATSLADDFHIYGVNWSPGSIQLTLDGVVYAAHTPSSLSEGQSWVFNKPFYLLLNLAVGGNWPGAPDETTPFPATMLVDWVRVYSTPTSSPTPTPTPTPSSTPTPSAPPAPTPTPADAVGPALAARNVTVKHDKTCRIYFRVNNKQSAHVTVRVAITTKSGVIKKHWSRRCDTNVNGWLWKKYTCRLKRGTYRIKVTGRDVAGNRASVVGRAKLVVK